MAIDASGHRQHNAKREIGIQTIAGHAAIARLEDVQRQRHPRKEHDMKWEQRYLQQSASHGIPPF
jgi:hypothetical protein